ncbi:hypothetical protein BDZ89DRAFT_102030 [Hymenopellis radicata]|nr:hypothetical protein BDZ89DRAFT_102030 [Hymenopellis radicata]
MDVIIAFTIIYLPFFLLSSIAERCFCYVDTSTICRTTYYTFRYLISTAIALLFFSYLYYPVDLIYKVCVQHFLLGNDSSASKTLNTGSSSNYREVRSTEKVSVCTHYYSKSTMLRL